MKEQLSPMWLSFFADTHTSILTWWNKDGREIWEGTGVEIMDIFGAWQTMSKDEFAVFWARMTEIMAEGTPSLVEGADSSGKAISNAFVTAGAAVEESTANMAMTAHQKMMEFKLNALDGIKSTIEPAKVETANVANGILGAFNNTLTSDALAPATDGIPASVAAQTENATVAAENLSVAVVDTMNKADYSSIADGIPLAIAAQTIACSNAATNLAMAARNAMQKTFNEHRPVITFDIQMPQISFKNAMGAGYRSFQTGGIVDRPMIASIGEKGKEAVVPLSTDALRPWARSIVAEMMSSNGGFGGGNVNFNIGTLIGNDQGYRELERRMYPFRIEETRRRA
jgi:hypothetical protein